MSDQTLSKDVTMLVLITILRNSLIPIIMIVSSLVFYSKKTTSEKKVGNGRKRGIYNVAVYVVGSTLFYAGLFLIYFVCDKPWTLILFSLPIILMLLNNVNLLQVIFSWRNETELTFFGIGNIILTLSTIYIGLEMLTFYLESSLSLKLSNGTYNYGVMSYHIITSYMTLFITLLFVSGIGIKLKHSDTFVQKVKRFEEFRKKKPHRDIRTMLTEKCPGKKLPILILPVIACLDILRCSTLAAYSFILDGIYLAEKTARLTLSFIFKLCEINTNRLITVRSVRTISLWSIILSIVLEYCYIIYAGKLTDHASELYAYISGIVIIPIVISRIIRLKV